MFLLWRRLFHNEKSVSIFAGHDSNISFYNAEKDEYHSIEIERLVQKDILDYMRIISEYQKDILIQCRDIAEREWVLRMTMKHS